MKASKRSHPLTEPLYPLNSFDQLNHLEQGNATNKLILLISKNVVQCGIRVYRILRDIKKEIAPITQKDLKKICMILGWPTNDHGIDYLVQRITADPKTARKVTYGDLIKPMAYRPPNYPLYILVIYLRRHLIRIKARPHNALISDFLSEQRINDKYSPDRISKVSRMDLQRLEDIYNLFLKIYEAPGSGGDVSLDSILTFEEETRRLAVNASADNPMRDIVFPSWKDFMP